MKDDKGCGGMNADQKEVAMTETGLSKMFDIQHNQFIIEAENTCDFNRGMNRLRSFQLFLLY